MLSFANLVRTGCLMVLVATLGAAPAQEPMDDDANIPDGLEVQTRGPVHEAFAQPNDLKPEPGPVVAKEPPPPVPEEAPEFRPEGNNIEWIPGYWAWDPERNDYLWVSGTYRDVPEGRRWVPGYWARGDSGWQWVSGFWASARQEEVPYTPEPPEPLNNDPNLPAPDEDSTWLPGYWYYNQSRFVWRPGYWAPAYENRVWVTPRYVWSPSGYLFCDGYWDYPYEDRGLLFAPVYFSRPLWYTAGWYYRPWYTVGLGLFYDHCFWRPGGFHFYFGNYYGGPYWGLGYRPWYTRYRWDSGFAHHHWHRHRHHGDRNWYGRQRQLYADRFDGRGSRPPRNLAEQRQFARDGKFAKNSDLRAVAPVQQAKLINNNVNVIKTSAQERTKLAKQVARNKELVQMRDRLDRKAVGAVGAKGITRPKTGETTSFRLPRAKDDDDIALTRPSSKGPTGPDSVKGGKDGGKTGVVTRPSDKKGAPPVVLTPGGKVGQPKVAQPKVGQPKVGQPKVGQPKVAQPQPKVGQPKVGQPKVGQPQVGQPKIGQPKVGQPKVGQPKVGQPKFSTPRIDSGPKSAAPRVGDSLPRVIESPRTPGGAKSTAPRIIDGSPSRPGRIETPAPRAQPAPRIQSPSLPRFEPRSTPAPRFSTPSAPRFSNPAPRYNPAPRSIPRASPAPRGRVSAPVSSPRFSAPSSAPRFSASPRSSGPRFSSAPGGGSSRSAPARSSSRGRGR